MRIAVVGAGALGSVIAGLLAVAREDPCRNGAQIEDIDIWLVGGPTSGPFVRAVRENGLRVSLADDARARVREALRERLLLPIFTVRATQVAEEVWPADLAIVAVKNRRTAEAAVQIKHLLAEDGLVLTLQNGLGNAETLSDILSGRVVTQGTTLLGATLLGPGSVLCAGINETSVATAQVPKRSAGRLQAFKSYMERVGARVELTPDVTGIVWGKLCANCAINPVAALLDVDNGTVVSDESARRTMRRVVDEVAAVAVAAGVRLPFPPEEAFDRVVRVAEINARNLCSMVQDFRRGRPTEVEALNGAVVRVAERLGVAVPVNRALADLIRALERMKKRVP